MILLPSKLRGLIKSRGFTIKSFGEQLGMTREGVYDILKRKYLKPDLIKKICEVLTTQPEQFIEYEYPDDVKKKLHDIDSDVAADFEKEISRLNSVIDDKNKIIDALQKALTMSERFINTFTKKVAHGTSPTKNKN